MIQEPHIFFLALGRPFFIVCFWSPTDPKFEKNLDEKKIILFSFFSSSKPTDPNFYVRISRNNIFPRLVNKIRTSNNPNFVLDDRNNLRGMLVL